MNILVLGDAQGHILHVCALLKNKYEPAPANAFMIPTLLLLLLLRQLFTPVSGAVSFWSCRHVFTLLRCKFVRQPACNSGNQYRGPKLVVDIIRKLECHLPTQSALGGLQCLRLRGALACERRATVKPTTYDTDQHPQHPDNTQPRPHTQATTADSTRCALTLACSCASLLQLHFKASRSATTASRSAGVGAPRQVLTEFHRGGS